MSEKVVSLTTRQERIEEVRRQYEEHIDNLNREEMLRALDTFRRDVERGFVTSMSIAVTQDDARQPIGGYFSSSSMEHAPALIGAIELQKQSIMLAFLDHTAIDVEE